MANKETAIQPVNFASFPVLSMPSSDVREIIQATLGEEGLSPRDLDRVKIPAGGALQWEVTTADGEGIVDELRGIILAQRQVRAYWPGEYNGEKVPPQCYSDDARIGHGDPGDKIPGHECARCPMAEFGSAKGGNGKGQACKLMRLVFLLREDQFLPILVALPPTSAGVAKQYLVRLASSGLTPYDVVTSIKLERTKNDGGIAYSRAVFSRAANLPDDMRASMRAYAEELRPALTQVRVNELDDPDEDPQAGYVTSRYDTAPVAGETAI